jgi:hypothetical protein
MEGHMFKQENARKSIAARFAGLGFAAAIGFVTATTAAPTMARGLEASGTQDLSGQATIEQEASDHVSSGSDATATRAEATDAESSQRATVSQTETQDGAGETDASSEVATPPAGTPSSADATASADAGEAPEQTGTVTDGGASSTPTEGDADSGASTVTYGATTTQSGQETISGQSQTAEGTSEAPAAADDPAPAAERTAADANAVVTTTLTSNMYRLYNPNSGEHFYTASLGEAKFLFNAGWRWEGIAWVAPNTSTAPVYRLYNPNAGDHHYTTSETERDSLVRAGWKYEGIGWYSDTVTGVRILREYNPNAKAGAHNFTSNEAENKNLVNLGWRFEGIAWYGAKADPSKIDGFWTVTNAYGSLQRYWVGSDARLAVSRLVTPSEGAGYYAYATGTGAVLRGRTSAGNGYFYLADNDGRLASERAGGDGWSVTDKYGAGVQRYWLVNQSGYALAKTGHFTNDGKNYWGLTDQGYVLRGVSRVANGVVLADNSGSLAWNLGWLVTSAYAGSLQRYYIAALSNGIHGALTGFFSAPGPDGTGSYDYYGYKRNGYVARNVLIGRGNQLWGTNNDGCLYRNKNITAAYDKAYNAARTRGGNDRYYLSVSVDDFLTFVFDRPCGTDDPWQTSRVWLCGTGRGDRTFRGYFRFTHRIYQDVTPPSVHYYLCCYAGDGKSWQSFHSILYKIGTNNTVVDSDGRGTHVSSGCIRLGLDEVKFIYDNCFGSEVYLF